MRISKKLYNQLPSLFNLYKNTWQPQLCFYFTPEFEKITIQKAKDLGARYRIDWEELASEGKLIFFDCLLKYSLYNNVPFLPWFRNMLNFRMIDYLRVNGNVKKEFNAGEKVYTKKYEYIENVDIIEGGSAINNYEKRLEILDETRYLLQKTSCKKEKLKLKKILNSLN